jgi:hypothetical protein
MKVHRQKVQEAPQEEEKAEATDEQQAASQGTPAMIITHVRCEGTDPRRPRPELGAPAMPVTHVREEGTDPRPRPPELGAPAMPITIVLDEGTETRDARPAKMTIKVPMVSQASKAIKKNKRPADKKKNGGR